jgi:YesN/AraC family two-component response regulator
MAPTILVVEDEALIAMHIKSILEEIGYNVVTSVRSVEDAITFIESNPPNLVLIDINLNKEKDGVHLGRYLLEKDSIPYLYITSYTDKSTLDRVNETRPHGYIVKPFKPSDITTTISVVLNNYKHREIEPVRAENGIPDVVPYRMKIVINYINDNLDKRIEIDELITISTWKRRHFSRLFLTYLHVSPYQYILSRKIEKAKALIVDSDLLIVEVAQELAFESYGNFCNAFKKIEGSTPEQYRRKFGR